MSIKIQSLYKQFGTFTALNDISLDIQSGDFVALLGPSGSGKTTLLRTIAGLEIPDSGQLLFHDTDVTGTSAKDRGIGFIFQHYALFRHMTVYDNIAFGLTVLPKEKRPSDQTISKKVSELLELIQLSWLKDKFPAQLSGGQKQRVALARALAVEPKVLLLDEPFGALDTKIRKELRNWLRNLHDTLKMTSVFVTHDVEEALEVADKVVIMHDGKIIQVDTPENIFHKPVNAFVYKFIADVNLFHAREKNGQSFEALIRPEDISIHLESNPSLETFEATIQFIKHVGPALRVVLIDTTGQSFETRLSSEDPLASKIYKGMIVFAAIDSKKIFLTDYQI